MGKLALVFAGQGAQAVGMGKELYAHSAAARAVFDLAEQTRPGTKRICFEGPAEALNTTIHTQPCLFAMDLACAAALEEEKIVADGAAGFSLGEIPAVVYAGFLSAEEGFALVCRRAEAMHACAAQTPGGMAAILKLPSDTVERICGGIAQTYPVNYNCPGQTVVAFAAEREQTVQHAVTEAGGRFVKLAVSGAFHSPLMDQAAQDLAAYLETVTVQTPRMPVYANVTALPYDNPKTLLAWQVNSSVRWQQTIKHMIADGFDTFIEVGAGKTLSGLIKKNNENVRILQVSDVASLQNTAAALTGR